MEDWALIRHLYHSEKLSKRAIATKLGIARDTVTNALTSEGPPKYRRPSVVSAIGAVEPKIRALLSRHPTMPATVIAERIGWGGSSVGCVNESGQSDPNTPPLTRQTASSTIRARLCSAIYGFRRRRFLSVTASPVSRRCW